MAIDRKLLEILCCPVTKHPVVPLSPGQLERVNAAIADGQVRTFDGTVVDTDSVSYTHLTLPTTHYV